MDFFDKIQDYLNGTLTAREQNAFEAELKQDRDLSDIVDNYPVIDKVLDYLIQEEVKKQLDKIPFPEKTYTLSELLEMFGVSEVYEDMVEATLRGNQEGEKVLLEVKKPANKVNCQKELSFELENSLPFQLTLSILHQKENLVIEKEISKNTKHFTCDLSKLPPGRYYWLLSAVDANWAEQTVCRTFFIRKDLMPDELKGL